MRWTRLGILAAIISGLGSVGIVLWPGEMRLVDSNPQSHEMVYSLEGEVELLFNKPVAKSAVKVTDPRGRVVSKGVETYKGVLLIVTVNSPNAPHGLTHGDYRVEWTATSTDGLEAGGAFMFHIHAHNH